MLEVVKNILFLIIVLSISLSSDPLIIIDLQEKSLTTSGLAYIIKADKKVIDFDKLKKLNLFNRKKIVSKAIYYDNGSFRKKKIKINFKRAYFYEGNFYMQDCFCDYNNSYIKADSAEYKKTYIEFKNLVLKKDKQIYHKFKYIVDTKEHIR